MNKKIFDFDRTIINENSPTSYARRIGKEYAAKIINSEFEKSCNQIIKETETPEKLIRKLDSELYKCLAKGTQLLKGASKSILYNDYELNKKISNIVYETSSISSLNILTCTDWRTAEYFVKNNIGCQYHIAGSEMEVKNGKLTGRIKKYIGIRGKMEYVGKCDFYGDSITDFGAFYETWQQGGKNYIVENGSTDLLLKAMKKFNIPAEII